MKYFTGTYETKVDAKGRLVLPARLKAQLPEIGSGQIIVSKGFEPCLVLYAPLEWNKVLSQIVGLNTFSDEQRNLQRALISRSMEVDIDAIGRFVIPKKLLDHAFINSDVILLGVGNKVEIWDVAQYEKIQIKDTSVLSQLAEKYLGKET